MPRDSNVGVWGIGWDPQGLPAEARGRHVGGVRDSDAHPTHKGVGVLGWGGTPRNIILRISDRDVDHGVGGYVFIEKSTERLKLACLQLLELCSILVALIS